MTLLELLAEAGVTEEEASEAVRRELVVAVRPVAALSPEQAEFIARHGGLESPVRNADQAAKEAALASLANAAAMAATSISVQEAARLIGVDPSRIHHRIRDRALYAYKLGARVRLPRWQFGVDGRPLPNLRAVLAVLARELHPLSVNGFMTTPNEDLSGSGPMTPADWLAGGGDPERVISLARHIDIW